VLLRSDSRGEALRTCSPSDFQECNTLLLTLVTMLCCAEVLVSSFLLSNQRLIPPPSPSVMSTLLSAPKTSTFLDVHTSEVMRCLSFCAWLISLNLMSSEPSMLPQMTELPPFCGWIVFHFVYVPQSLYSLPWSMNRECRYLFTCWCHFLWIYVQEWN
jgi:hypothetical protein